MGAHITSRNAPAPEAWKKVCSRAETWHHLIPAALLLRVWNRLLDLYLATQWPEARIAIRQFLALCNRKLSGVDELLDRMNERIRTQRRDRQVILQELEGGDTTLIEAAVIWPAWNAVGGPSNRSDDPKDGNVYDKFRVGLMQDELHRIQAIELLLEEFRFFLNATSAGQPVLRRLASAIQALRPLIVCDDPIPFRDSMWIKVDGSSRKRREGE